MTFNFFKPQIEEAGCKKIEPIIKVESEFIDFVIKDKYETKNRGTDSFWFVDTDNNVYNVNYTWSVECYSNLYVWKTANIGDTIKKLNRRSSTSLYQIIGKANKK